MSNLAFVYQRVEAGDRIRFFHDYYGRQWVELSRGWFLTHKTRVYLAPQEILQLKASLRRRRPGGDSGMADEGLATGTDK